MKAITFDEFVAAEEKIKWDVDVEMDIPSISQKEGFDCGIACKKGSDRFFGLNDQSGVNSDFFDIAAKNKGLTNTELTKLYREGGYMGNFFSGGFQKENVLNWMASEMKSGHVVNISLKVEGGYHASLVRRVRFMNDFSKFRISLRNPSSTYMPVSDFSKYNQMFSVWRK